MGCKIIIGDYKIQKGDVVINNFHPAVIKKKKGIEHKGNLVLFAESLSLKRSDVEYIMKQSTDKVVLVCESKKALGGARKARGVKIEYSEDYSEAASPFDIAKLIATCNDRDFVFNFLKYNRVSMYMVVKTLISNYMYMRNKSNIKTIAWLDENLYTVNPEFLWAYSAYKFRPENLKYMKWNFPKKENV